MLLRLLSFKTVKVFSGLFDSPQNNNPSCGTLSSFISFIFPFAVKLRLVLNAAYPTHKNNSIDRLPIISIFLCLFFHNAPL